MGVCFSKKLNYGKCPDCKKTNKGEAWCNEYDPGKFLKVGKTSGNSEIDNFIYEAQLKTTDYNNNLEWIPYRFQDIKPIGEGGFANIYSPCVTICAFYVTFAFFFPCISFIIICTKKIAIQLSKDSLLVY